MILLCASTIWASSDAHINIFSVLDVVSIKPEYFFVDYLVDRSPSPDAQCPSTSAAACFCYYEDPLQGDKAKCDISSDRTGDSSSWGTDSAIAADALVDIGYDRWGVGENILKQDRCSIYEPCARDCDEALFETGNCAASVFEYQCSCGPQCNVAVVSNASSMSQIRPAGLPHGLKQCYDEYLIRVIVIWIGCLVFFFASLAICIS